MKKHNGIISFWKFMFTLLIIAGHIKIHGKFEGQFLEAYTIGVEFFFLVSGYLMTKNALKKNNEELGKTTFDYIFKKVKVFFPYILLAFSFGLILNTIRYKLKKYEIIGTIWDMLLLRMAGAKYFMGVHGVTWYISAMLICMIILYPLLIKYKKNFIYIGAPLIVFVVGGYIAHIYGNISKPTEWCGIVYKGTLRAFFELALGSIIFLVSEKIGNTNFNLLGRIMLTIIEIVGFSSIFFVINLKDSHTKYDFIMILILFISISIAFSEKSLLQKFSNNKYFYFLERISLPMYLNQTWVMDLYYYFFDKQGLSYLKLYQNILILIPAIFIVALITEPVVKLMKNGFNIIKKLFIISEVNN